MNACNWVVVLKTTNPANERSVIFGPFPTAVEILRRVTDAGYNVISDEWKEYDFNGEIWRVAVAERVARFSDQ